MKQTISLDIKGMNCASCVNRIETGLKKKEGITEATINLATEKGNIIFDSSQIAPTQILATVRELGYEASLSSPLGAKNPPSPPTLWGGKNFLS